jgi:translocation and assembly module TamA
VFIACIAINLIANSLSQNFQWLCKAVTKTNVGQRDNTPMKTLCAALLLMAPWGLLLAQAQPTTAPDSPQSVGNTAKGDAAFSLSIDAPDDLRELLERHLDILRYRNVSDLSDGELARLLLAADKDARTLLATQGYFSPTIALHPPVSTTGPVARTLTLTVEPGEPTEVSDVEIVLTGAIRTDAQSEEQRDSVTGQWWLESGMRFSQTRWVRAKQEALLLLTTQNYPTARIVASQADVDPVNRRARLSVTLDSGPRYRLGELVISGLHYFDKNMVRRLVRLGEQDYDQADLVAAQQRLTDSGYFDSAFISLDTTADPAAAPVLVQLREAKLQKLVLGVGASTDTGARLSIEHSHYKIPLLDWRGVNKLLLARDVTALTSTFTSHPNDDSWRWVVGTVVQQQTLGSFLVHSQSARVGRNRSTEPLDNDYFLQYDRADAATSDATARDVVEAMSLNYAFTTRHFDHALFPDEGWGLGMSMAVGTTVGAQSDAYGRLLTRWQSYVPLRGSDSKSSHQGRLALRAQAGAIVAAPTAELPSTQLFFIGGDSSVRGYGYQDLGVPLPDGKISGGRFMALGSMEWQRPIRIDGRASDWESSFFIDAGAVANNSSELRPKVGVGAGARWKSPVGPLQIDLAYGIEVQRLRLHVNVGFHF